MAYERIIAHPYRSEAISITGNGILTRWALGKAPQRLASVITEYDRTWMDMAVSPSGEEFFLVNQTDRVERRRWEDLELVGEIPCPTGTEPHRVAVSPDGATIAVSGFGVGDYLLDAKTGKIETVLSGEPGLYVCFSPDGRWLACAENNQGGGTLYLYELGPDRRLTGRYALKAFEPSTFSLVNPVFSPDSQWIAVFENYDFMVSEEPGGWFGNLLLFAVEAGEGVWLTALEAPDLSEEIAERSEMERLLDPTNLFFGDAEIVCGMPSGDLAFFSVENGEQTREIPVAAETPITGVAVDRSLQAIWIVLDGGAVKVAPAVPSLRKVPPPPLAPVASLPAALEIDGHARTIHDLVFSPDSTGLLTVSADKTACIWDIANGHELLRIELETEATTATFSPDSSRFAVGGRQLIVLDRITGNETLRLEDPSLIFRQFEFTPDGQFLYCNLEERVPLLLDAATGLTVFTLKRSTVRNFARKDAEWMQSMWMKSLPKEVQAKEVKRRTSIPSDERVELSFLSVACTPDGAYLLAVTDEQRVECWIAPQGPQVPHFLQHETGINSVKFSADGRRCLTSGPTARLWDAATGRMLIEYKDCHPTTISLDGNSVAGADDTIFGAKIWDALTGEERHRMTGHTDSVSCVAFSPDGKHFATGSWDRTVKIWRIPS